MVGWGVGESVGWVGWWVGPDKSWREGRPTGRRCPCPIREPTGPVGRADSRGSQSLVGCRLRLSCCSVVAARPREGSEAGWQRRPPQPGSIASNEWHPKSGSRCCPRVLWLRRFHVQIGPSPVDMDQTALGAWAGPSNIFQEAEGSQNNPSDVFHGLD